MHPPEACVDVGYATIPQGIRRRPCWQFPFALELDAGRVCILGQQALEAAIFVHPLEVLLATADIPRLVGFRSFVKECFLGDCGQRTPEAQ